MDSQRNSANSVGALEHGATEHGGCLSQLTQLLREENITHQDSDHEALKREGSKATSLVWRERVAQWCYDVVDHLHESRKLVFISMNILDRYFVTCAACSSDRAFEAAALTALFLAVRIRGSHVLEVTDLVRMSRLGVTIREIVEVGKDMTRSLSFERKLFTPSDFVSQFLELVSDINGSGDVSSNAVYFTELCVVDSFFVGVKASEIALASVLLALDHDTAALMMTLLSPVSDAEVSMEKIMSLKVRVNGLRKKTSGGVNVPHVILDTDDDGELSVMPRLNPPVRVVSQDNLRMKRSSTCLTLATLVESDCPTDTMPKRPVSPITEEEPTKRRRIHA